MADETELGDEMGIPSDSMKEGSEEHLSGGKTVVKKPLFDDELEEYKDKKGDEGPVDREALPESPSGHKDKADEDPQSGQKDISAAANGTVTEEIPSSPKRGLKWIFIGGIGFLLILAASFFFAAMYVHKKEAVLNRGESPKIAIKSSIEKGKRIIIRQHDLSPFFLRLKNKVTGEDRFLSAQIYIEFVRKKLPDELKTRREVLRTLIYKQLLRHFAGGKDSPTIEKKFKKELIPSLNAFFKGGGVYDIGFKELTIR